MGVRVGPWGRCLLALLCLVPFQACRRHTQPLRLGCFANLTHAQALLGKSRGDFRVQGRPVAWRLFNAGPTEMEALLAGELDAAYVGPNPAVNAWLRSGRTGLKILAGSVSGGASLVLRPASGIRGAADFRGRKVASPELGNTQDVALRSWLRGAGLEPGRDVKVLPVKNPEILSLFVRGQVDAAWVPEPWATRLVQEAGGVRFLDEADLWPEGRFTTAVLVGREAWMREHPDEVRTVLRTHVALTAWIAAHPEAAAEGVRKALEAVHGSPLRPDLVREAFRFLRFTDDPLAGTIQVSAERAWKLGFLPERPERLEDLVDRRFLQEVKAEGARP